MTTLDAPATQNHALRMRLAGPAGTERLARRLGTLAGPARLWTQRLPWQGDDPRAARRRDRELARPVDADPGLRAVLLEYADDTADLVLVAHRAVHGPRWLRDLLDAVLAEDPATRVPAGPATAAGPVPAFAEAPAWGQGDGCHDGIPSEHRIALAAGTTVEPAEWLAALAVVLTRYDPEQAPVVAALVAGGRDELTLPALDVTAGGTLGDLVAALRDGPAEPVDAASRVTAGIVFGSGDDHPAEQVPSLATYFPLTILFGRDAGGNAEIRCRYRPRGIASPIAAQFLRHLVHVHRQVVAEPTLPIGSAELFDDAERDRVRALGRPSRPLVSTPRRLPDVFADRVAEQPDAVALADEKQQLTYRELDERSDRLAHALRAAGVHDGALVGVCLDRSAELVALLLAVLKAGAVYVPMDPAYPADRLAYTVDDAGLAVLVTTLDDLPHPPGVRVLTPEQLAALGVGAPAGPPRSAGTPADPAYVIYTSGSTGRPKGVLVPHANVISLLDATRDDFGLGPADVWTFFHSVAFDFSVWEIWGCLLTGGRLMVVPYWVSRSPEQFHDLLVDRGVTVLNQTPSSFAQLAAVDRARAGRLPVRLVIFGGEPLDSRSLLPWLDRHPESRCRLVNMFGITETTVHVTAETVTRGLALAASRSVGRALPGWHLYVLDTTGRPAPPGVAGEIYVGGAGVAIGYLGRPELTAERFPEDARTGERMYRTGDRGRLRPDGRLEHLGRLDNQIKLRGFRIELDEIRTVLSECPGVDAAAVVLRQDDPADAATGRLDAYVVLADGAVPRVQDHLARMLPDYMRPATVTALPALPTTTNGKVDVAALPAPVLATPGAAAAAEGSAPAADGLSDDLLDVWEKVFGFPVAMTDDFFALGGNSLLAVRMAAAMRERGLPALHPRTLYLHSTVGRLAEALRS
jgi:amino acid adenylation domain-containing protein